MVAVARDSLASSERTARFEGDKFGAQSSFFWVRSEPGEGVELHRNPYSETFILLSGRATFLVDGELCDASGNQIVVVRAHQAHRFTNSGNGPLEMIAIHASPVMITEWLDEASD
jgi:mannose-6-phosphate isomerase-like protein (cupin superfamily)